MAVGRNQPCPCGSGRKFKRCCLGAANAQPLLLHASPMEAEELLWEDETGDYDETDPVERIAHAIAAKVAAQGDLTLDRESREFLAESPECLLFFLEGFLKAGNPQHREADDHLADAYLTLIGVELNILRATGDFGDSWTRQVLDDFETRLVDALRGGEATLEQIISITEIMLKERIQPGPELAALFGEAYERLGAIAQPPDPAALCAQIAAECEGDPFAVRDVLFSSIRFTGAISSELIGALFSARQNTVSDGAALGVLDPQLEVRSAVAAALLVHAPNAITSATLRRLIAIRRWLPESERAPIDQAVRAARLGGVECAQWKPGAGIVEIRVSSPDGAGAQMAMIVSNSDGGYRLSGILFKGGAGIPDAWTSDPQSMREIKGLLNERSSDVYLLRGSRRYLDLMVGYYLKDALNHGVLPAPRLLELAEYLQAPQWQPMQPGWRELLADLLKEVRGELLNPNSVNAIIATSAKWGMKRKWSQSWAEDGEAVGRLLARMDGRLIETVCEKIIDKILEKRREVWAERFTLTALWMKEAPKCSLPWEHFAIVAHKIVEGMALRKLPLMHSIAEATAFL
jgi:hypothetical protein